MIDVLLDVDGVLNVFPEKNTYTSWGWGQSYDEGDVTVGECRFRITWSSAMIEALNAFSQRTDVQFYWLTTWLTEAPKYLPDLIGIDGRDWPVLGAVEHASSGYLSDRWWKHTAAEEHFVKDMNRTIWIDDDHGLDRGSIEWLALVQPRVLPVKTLDHVGITRSQYEEFVRFADE